MNDHCKTVRRNILLAANKSRHGHIPSCFSVVEILHSLYSVMQHDPQNPEAEDRDVFILSKGHASLALYVTLADAGYFEMEGVNSYGLHESQFGCHPDRLKIPGVEASTGSLGHGIGIAVGVAMALKMKNSDRRVYTLVGDGEANEGSVWEALLVANHQKLDNFTVIYDNNMSHERGLQIADPVSNLKGFGCEVVSVDGHDIEALKGALSRETGAVNAVVANTVKGFGCPTMTENHYAWHHRFPKDEELDVLLAELEAS